jgi:hypothetical protein
VSISPPWRMTWIHRPCRFAASPVSEIFQGFSGIAFNSASGDRASKRSAGISTKSPVWLMSVNHDEGPPSPKSPQFNEIGASDMASRLWHSECNNTVRTYQAAEQNGPSYVLGEYNDAFQIVFYLSKSPPRRSEYYTGRTVAYRKR